VTIPSLEAIAVLWGCSGNKIACTIRRLGVAKSQDKKQTSNKKKPLKSIKEKRAAKKSKKAEKDAA
jgi:hypothetical protein